MAWLRCPAVSERRSILLLCDEHRSHAANLLQHVNALHDLSAHEVLKFNPIDRPDACEKLELEEFDAVVVHYSIAVWSTRYLHEVLAWKLEAFRGLKVQFIQDEYRRVDDVTAKMRRLGIDVLFTCVPEPAASELYDSRLPGVTRITTLPGYVPDELVGRETPPPAERPVDVGYRARELPFWLGRLGREKVEIARDFLAHAPAYDLRCDISSREEDRIYGEAWNRFVASCRATLGTESGSSIVDFDGSLEARGKDYVARHPEVDREQVERDLTGEYEGNVVIATASPRLFEAAALRTAMILFPGHYSGVVEPWTHYLPLEKDFSNLTEVVKRLRDRGSLEELTERAYDDLIASGRYSLRALVDQLDDVVSARSPARAPRSKPAYRRAVWRRQIPSWRQPSKLRVLAGTVLSPFVGSALIVRDATLRRLALAGLSSPRGLGRDLWRLTALRNGVRRGAFHVRPELDGDGVLLFSSRPGPPPEGRLAGTATALADGSVDEIVWNHSRLAVAAGLGGGALLAIPVGHHGVDGAYSFATLAALAKRKPKPVLAALEPLLREPVGEPAQQVGVEA
jgi:hypothetical protein